MSYCASRSHALASIRSCSVCLASQPLLLCGIGLYAVIAASVRQRYAEIGVRLAVGASPADRMILREGMLLAGGGATAGLVLALVVTQFLRGLLYEVHPLDPIALVTAAILLLAAAVGVMPSSANRSTDGSPPGAPRVGHFQLPAQSNPNSQLPIIGNWALEVGS